MRFELAGTSIRPAPIVIRIIQNENFYPDNYVQMEYTNFEVICIGAGGGTGGGIDTGDAVRSYGGAGGGGGYHRVRGILLALPNICPVVIGLGGSPGTDHASNPGLTTHGADGGYSSFNDTTCRASGGQGGRRVQTNSLTASTLAHGGVGGVGNRINPGGGAVGGAAGSPSPPVSGVAGVDGTFFTNVGKGGGGGAGGLGQYGVSEALVSATAGGRGSYNPGDTSVYGPGFPPSNDPIGGGQLIVPGSASGAKASPLTGLPTVYGQSGKSGIVVLRLTSE